MRVIYSQLQFLYMSDKNFWEAFYSNKKGVLNPSPFATFLIENYTINGSMVELGCGNGRDSLYFAKQGIDVLGIDQCKNIVSELNGLALKNTEFKVADFTKLDNLGNFDTVYSRFTLHSVNKNQASDTMMWAFKYLKQGGKFCIEVRSVNDNFCGEGKEVETDAFVTDHYRRFIRLDEMVNELKEIGFSIEYQIEATSLAKYKNEDPSVIRIVAIKK